MKRLALMAVAAVTAFAPLAAAPAYADPPRHSRDYDRGDRYDRRGDYRDDRRDYRGDRRDERRAYNEGRRDGYRESRWDNRRHNGYNYNGRWYYGPPPAAYYGRPGFNPGYTAWRRGDRVPAYYRDRYQRVDYRHYRQLNAPPRGYHWVRDDRGDYLLVGIATGVILSAILSN